MKKTIALLVLTIFLISTLGCATGSNQQSGAVAGAAGGAAIGGLIGGDWLGALIGAGIGLVVGGAIGTAIDAETAKSAKIEAARTNERVIYYTDDRNQAVESTPMESASTDCTKVRTKIYEQGRVISDVTEEVCRGKRTTRTY